MLEQVDFQRFWPNWYCIVFFTCSTSNHCVWRWEKYPNKIQIMRPTLANKDPPSQGGKIHLKVNLLWKTLYMYELNNVFNVLSTLSHTTQIFPCWSLYLFIAPPSIFSCSEYKFYATVSNKPAEYSTFNSMSATFTPICPECQYHLVQSINQHSW